MAGREHLRPPCTGTKESPLDTEGVTRRRALIEPVLGAMADGGAHRTCERPGGSERRARSPAPAHAVVDGTAGPGDSSRRFRPSWDLGGFTVQVKTLRLTISTPRRCRQGGGSSR